MAFTMVPLTHTFLNPDGTPASGSVRFSLSGRMTNGTSTIMPAEPITATLDASGHLSQTVPANDDTATVSTDTYPHWDVTISIAGARTEEYAIVVPSVGGANPVDLFSLIPNQAQVG